MLQPIEFVSGCSKGPVVIAVAVWLRCYILVTIIRMSPDIIHTRLLMRDTVVENLILDLLEWLALRDRSYEEVMEAWRTSCPKLPVWEEANDRGLVTGVEGKGCSDPANGGRHFITPRAATEANGSIHCGLRMF